MFKSLAGFVIIVSEGFKTRMRFLFWTIKFNGVHYFFYGCLTMILGWLSSARHLSHARAHVTLNFAIRMANGWPFWWSCYIKCAAELWNGTMIDAMKNQQKPTTIVLGVGGYVILYILKVGKRRALVTCKIPIGATELSCGSVCVWWAKYRGQ